MWFNLLNVHNKPMNQMFHILSEANIAAYFFFSLIVVCDWIYSVDAYEMRGH